MKIGNTTFNLEALKGITRSDFMTMYEGKLNVDINEAWKAISKEVKKLK